MSSIDKRVVQMQFDNAQFQAGIKQTMSSLKDLDESLQLKNGGKGFEDAQKAAQGFVQSNGIEGAVESIQSKFSAFGAVAFSVLQRITNAAIDCATNLANMLVVQPITEGFAEYEQGIGSTQTIVNATGESLDRVNQKLSELNEYSDRTIYKFSDMTGAIGKFTNAGVSLDDAVLAIKGISNEAALAGASTQQASSAMYNFSQALSTGYLGLMDWRSIENAMMATQGFREELIRTGVEMGTLVEQNGKYISTTTSATGAISKEFDAMSGFRDSLQSQWITNDVLIATLARYGDETQEIGRKAYMAATEVKTFTQLVDTAAEAMGTGWADSFKLIIGDYEEAKELWTGVSNVLGGMIDSYHNARNAQLQMWRDMGGRELLIQGISDAWQGISSRLGAVGTAFREAFPDNRAQILYKISEAVSKFGAALKASDDDISRIHDTASRFFGALSKIFGSIGNIVGKLLNPFKQLLPVLGSIGNVIGAVFGGIGKIGLSILEGIGGGLEVLANAIGNAQVPAEAMSNALDNVADNIRSFFDNLQNGLPSLDWFKEKMEAVLNFIPEKAAAAADGIKNFAQSVKEKFKIGGDDAEKFSDRLNKAYDNVDATIDDAKPVTPILSSIKEFFTNLYNGIARFLSTITFGDVVNAWLGLVSAGWLALIANLTGSIKNIGTSIKEAITAFTDEVKEGTEKVPEAIDPVTDALEGFKGILQAYANEINARALINVGIAVGVLAAAVLVLSNIEPANLRNSVTAITILTGVLVAVSGLAMLISRLASRTDKATKSAKSIKDKFFGALRGFADGLRDLGGLLRALAFMTVVSIAVLNLAKAVAVIAQVGDPGAIAIATVVVTLLMGMMALLYKSLEKVKVSNVTGQIGVMLVTAIALRQLVRTVAEAGDLDGDQAAKGLFIMATVLAAFIGTLKSIEGVKVNPSTIITLTVITNSLLVLGWALKQLSQIGWDGILSGLTGMAGSLAALSAATIVLNKFQGGTDVGKIAQLIVMTGVIASLGHSLEQIAAIGWEGLAAGLTGMAGALAIFIGGMAVLSKANVSFDVSTVFAMVTMAIAIKVLGNNLTSLAQLTWSQIGSGLVAMGGTLAIFIAALAVLGKIGGGFNIGALLQMVVMAITLSTLGNSLQTLSQLSWEGIGVALTAMAGALAIMVAVMAILSAVGPIAVAGAAAMLIASISLAGIANALNSLETEDMGGKMGTLAAALGILAVGLTAMIAALPGAAALLVVSFALQGLATGLQAFSAVDPSAGEKVGQVCLSMALGLTAMIAALPGAAALLVVSAALPQLAAGLRMFEMVGDPADLGNKIRDLCLALAIGLTAMIAALPGAAALAVAAPALVQLAPALKQYQELDMWGIAAGIGPLLLALAAGLVAMTAGIIGAAALVIAAAGLQALLPVVQQYSSMDMGAIKDTLGQFLATLSEGMVKMIPAAAGAASLMLVCASLSMLMSVMTSMQGMDLVGTSEMLNTLGQSIQDLMGNLSGIDPGVLFGLAGGLMALSGGMAVASGAITGFSSAVGLAASTIAADTQTIIENVSKLESDVASTGGRIASQAVSKVTETSSQVISQLNNLFAQANAQINNGMNQAANTIQNGISRIAAMQSQAYSAGRSVMMGVVNGLKSVSVDGYSIGANLVSSAISGVRSQASAAYSAGASVGSSISSGLKNNLKIASPSKVGTDIGQNFGLSVIGGVKNKLREASLVGAQFGDVVGNSIYELIDNVEKFTNMPLTPTITPVIDGTDARAGVSTIRDMLNDVGFNIGGVTATFDMTPVTQKMDDILRKMDNIQNGVNITINGELMTNENIRSTVLDLFDQVQRAGMM